MSSYSRDILDCFKNAPPTFQWSRTLNPVLAASNDISNIVYQRISFQNINKDPQRGSTTILKAVFEGSYLILQAAFQFLCYRKTKNFSQQRYTYMEKPLKSDRTPSTRRPLAYKKYALYLQFPS